MFLEFCVHQFPCSELECGNYACMAEDYRIPTCLYKIGDIKEDFTSKKLFISQIVDGKIRRCEKFEPISFKKKI